MIKCLKILKKTLISEMVFLAKCLENLKTEKFPIDFLIVSTNQFGRFFHFLTMEKLVK